MARRRDPWMQLGLDTWALGVEAASVMGLRGAKLAVGGPAAGSESVRMIAEKVEAAHALGQMAMTGRLGASVPGALNKAVKHYRRKVRANRRRLTRG